MTCCSSLIPISCLQCVWYYSLWWCECILESFLVTEESPLFAASFSLHLQFPSVVQSPLSNRRPLTHTYSLSLPPTPNQRGKKIGVSSLYFCEALLSLMFLLFPFRLPFDRRWSEGSTFEAFLLQFHFLFLMLFFSPAPVVVMSCGVWCWKPIILCSLSTIACSSSVVLLCHK